MSSITSVGTSLTVNLAGFTGSLTAANPRATPATAADQDNTAPPSTRLTLNSPIAIDVVYAKPKAVQDPPLVQTRSWASSPQDDISALMGRNGSKSPRGGLADPWRGLGGALLSRFATTQADYRQTMADGSALHVAGMAGVAGPQALDSVPHGAATVSLQIKTRSGQTVELTIAVNDGLRGASRGLQVAVTSSGRLSDSERAALAQLADGFDRALDGLGQPGKPRLDLAGLMDYDSSVLAGVDLTVKNPTPAQALSSFTLSLGAHHKTLAWKGEAGEIALNLDAAPPLGTAPAQQRQAAVQQHLQQFDAAAQRSHADAALVALFKDAFSQLHGTPSAPAAAPQHDALGATLTRQVQPLLSGLADFQARFGGDFEKTNERGAVNETGRVDYQLSQQTTKRRHGASGDVSVEQTQREQLDAHYLQSRHGGMLDTGIGNYDITRIQDHSTTKTLIETAKDMLASAVQHTDQHQLLTWQKLVNHRVEEQRETPREKRFSHSLL